MANVLRPLETITGFWMTTLEKIAYNFVGFILCFVTAAIVTVGLHTLVAYFWIPLPSLLFVFGSRLAIISAAIVSTVICLLWFLNNDEIRRGVWCFIYVLVGVALITLAISLF